MNTPPPASSSPRPAPLSQSSMNLRQRFGYYLIGASFSCVLMGMYFVYVSKVRREARAEQEARQAGQPLPVPGVPLNPPKPPVP